MAWLGRRKLISLALEHATGRRDEPAHTETVQVRLVRVVPGRGRDFRPEIWAQKRAAAWRTFTVAIAIGRPIFVPRFWARYSAQISAPKTAPLLTQRPRASLAERVQNLAPGHSQ